MVKKAAKAVELATEKMRQLNLEVFERGLKIEKLSQELAAAGIEVDQTRDRANKLEERFTQVENEHDRPWSSRPGLVLSTNIIPRL